MLVDFLYPGFVSESLQITFSPKHRWLYWPRTLVRSSVGSWLHVAFATIPDELQMQHNCSSCSAKQSVWSWLCCTCAS